MDSQLIASPFPDGYLLVRPGREGGVRIGSSLYAQLRDSPTDAAVPAWLIEAASKAFGVDVAENTIGNAVMAKYPPYRVTLSIYGGTEASYDAMTRRRGSFKNFMRGLAAAHEAGLNLRVNIVVSRHNSHEIPLMHEIAERHGAPAFEYSQLSPTIHGGAEVLPSQANEIKRDRTPYTGCNAGITHYHADPQGKASICKIGRQNQVDLIAEGTAGLSRLVQFAAAQNTRHGGCSGCGLQKTYSTCMPLVTLYRQARAPLERYCQH